jgi:hypothetical protein
MGTRMGREAEFSVEGAACTWLVQEREAEKCKSLNSIRTFIATPEIHIQAIDCPSSAAPAMNR